MKKRFFAYSFVMTLILLGAIYGHLHTGFSDMSTSDLIRILFGGGNDVENLTVFDFRLVRTILAVFIGMGLAMSGAIFQTISRNELASPSLLGVNAGAGLGVVCRFYNGVGDLDITNCCRSWCCCGSAFNLSFILSRPRYYFAISFNLNRYFYERRVPCIASLTRNAFGP